MQNTNSSTTSATFGSTPAQGNVLLAHSFTSNKTLPVAGTGWTLIGTPVGTGTGTSTRSIGSAYKVAGAGESTSQTPFSAGNTGGVMLLEEWSGLDTTGSPVDAASFQANAAGASQATPSITPTAAADRLLLALFGLRRGLGPYFSAETIGGSGATEDDELTNNTNISDLAMAYQEVAATSGAYSGSATSSDTSDVGASGIIALLVAAVAGGAPPPRPLVHRLPLLFR